MLKLSERQTHLEEEEEREREKTPLFVLYPNVNMSRDSGIRPEPEARNSIHLSPMWVVRMQLLESLLLLSSVSIGRGSESGTGGEFHTHAL